MDKIPDFLVDKKLEVDPIYNRLNKAEESYINLFGDSDDLDKYLSTWDYDDEDFLKLAKKIENCVKLKKRYKKMYLTIFDRILCKIKYMKKNYYE